MIYGGPGVPAVVSFNLAPPSTPYPPLVSKLLVPHIDTEKERQIADGRRGMGVGEEPNHRQRESLVLYKSPTQCSLGPTIDMAEEQNPRHRPFQ
jgi:hypothetical protein